MSITISGGINAEDLRISRNAIRNWVKSAEENSGEVPTRHSGNYASDEEKENAWEQLRTARKKTASQNI